MPKDMFFNIPEEKRQMFVQVAVEEFSTKSFEEVSVNSIIKKANISRGSFYTYFDNLEELLHYIMQPVKDERIKHIKDFLDESNSNFFEFVRKLFLYDYDKYNQNGTHSLFKNYIHFIQVVKKGSLKDNLIKDFLGTLSDPDFLKLKNVLAKPLELSEDEFFDLIEVSLILMVNTFIKSENEHLNKRETISIFNHRITQLEFGVRKRS
ncbi:TetR/AcrR family transcriptional regulator [Mariniplasma anaerobium]|uniref:Uncharacterized protein n=1 Tax=Mariniplasma anaerobium TaxID=2735436 RepID=A0A7U9XWB4_9MOLU|nr:TetR/AcrR family transcriptional regulator [Mariniplasma anaerobium]BCR36209.1 hypothetical protein MPAN_011020 [Mariniplasma anaerobium]